MPLVLTVGRMRKGEKGESKGKRNETLKEPGMTMWKPYSQSGYCFFFREAMSKSEIV